MTGNTKVWRAPLAGLASVAMIATMGVAASTANAANLQYPDVTVTLDANGGSFVGTPDPSTVKTAGYVDQAQTQLKLTDKQDQYDNGNYAAADGVFEGLYDKFGARGFVTNSGFVFTGWYTSPDAGGSAVDPSEALEDGTTLYAHWAVQYSTESQNGVTFDLTNDAGKTVVESIDPDGASSDVVTPSADGKSVYVRLADGDTVADWETPSVDVAGDGYVFDKDNGWDKTVSSAVRGTVLKAKAAQGVVVTFGGSGYDLYKDGKWVGNNGYKYDVLRNGTLKDLQAVKTTGPQLAYQWKYIVGSGTTGETVIKHGDQLTLTDETEIKVTPADFQTATVYRVHPSYFDPSNRSDHAASGDDILRYYAAGNSTFADAFGADALDDAVRSNTKSFLGWFNADAKVSVKDSSATASTTASWSNYEFFDKFLIKGSDSVDPWKSASPVKYTFKTAEGTGYVDLIAGYANAARFRSVKVVPLYDQAKAVTIKLYNDQKIGDQLKAAASQWARSGYDIEGYYTLVAGGKVITGSKVDADKTVSNTYPSGDTLYVNYQETSKYGVNGLLSYLSLGYATGVDTSVTPNVLKFSSTPAVPVPTTVTELADKSGYKNPVKTDDGFVVAQPEGYNTASWKAFNETRAKVVKELISELSLKKDSTIADVYNAVANRLSKERADAYNQEFAGKLVANTDYPDVNYDDYGTHHQEVTYLTDKGIVKGYPDGTFGYGAPVARVDFIVWLYRAAGSPKVDSQSSFSDVTAATVPNQEFRDAIAWAAANKITTGYADGTFAPYAPIARQDAVAFLYRASGETYNEAWADAKFADVTAGDTANHSEAVLWAAHYGIAKGYSGSVNRFGGLNIVVRQDAAAFLARTIQAGKIK